MRLLTVFLFPLARCTCLDPACRLLERSAATKGPTPTLDEANLTVEEVYARFAEAINRPGSIYRVTTRMEH